jgi:hypothetical protein
MVSEVQYIPDSLMNNLDKNKYANLFEYVRCLNKAIVRSRGDDNLKNDERFKTLDGRLP